MAATLGPDETQRDLYTLLLALARMKQARAVLVPHELATLRRAGLELWAWARDEEERRPLVP